MKEKKTAPAVTSEERELVFELSQGIPQLIHRIGHIRLICLDARDTGFQGYLDILRWLKRNKLTGATLVAWMNEKHENSVLKTIAHVRKKVHSDFKIRKIFAKPL